MQMLINIFSSMPKTRESFFISLSSKRKLWNANINLQDPSKDPQLSFGDFAAAAELDPDNADIYHHRGQVDRITLSYVLIVLNFLNS